MDIVQYNIQCSISSSAAQCACNAKSRMIHSREPLHLLVAKRVGVENEWGPVLMVRAGLEKDGGMSVRVRSGVENHDIC